MFKLELVLEETLMNLVWHAFKDGGRHLFDVTVQVQSDAVSLCFEDDGVPFDPLGVAPPNLPTSIDQATPGGLGLMLVRKTARSVAYERVDGRNRLTIGIAIN